MSRMNEELSCMSLMIENYSPSFIFILSETPSNLHHPPFSTWRSDPMEGCDKVARSLLHFSFPHLEVEKPDGGGEPSRPGDTRKKDNHQPSLDDLT